MYIVLKKHKGKGLEPRVELSSVLNRVSRNWILKGDFVRDRSMRTTRALERVCKDTKE